MPDEALGARLAGPDLSLIIHPYRRRWRTGQPADHYGERYLSRRAAPEWVRNMPAGAAANCGWAHWGVRTVQRHVGWKDGAKPWKILRLYLKGKVGVGSVGTSSTGVGAHSS